MGRNIKLFRSQTGLSQLDLALKLGVSTTFMSNIETGQKWVSDKTLSKIAQALKVEVYELFKPKRVISEDIDASLAPYLDGVNAAIIKTIEEAVKTAAKSSVIKTKRYLAKERGRAPDPYAHRSC